ncbi:hypothetical protein [Streptomyces globosus]|uniref:hypothetical protein n=1 Tax=Streptomyces globosus TaxID=68209 RepID=UPI0031D93083
MAHDGDYEDVAVRYDRGSADSVHNTLLDPRCRSEELADAWQGFGSPAPVVRFFRRPLGAVVAGVHRAGLGPRGLYEPRADPARREEFGDRYGKLLRTPSFLVLVLGHPIVHNPPPARTRVTS